ncbi:MAG: CocE/NonD family hydrolase [Chloroflexota bacterium]
MIHYEIEMRLNVRVPMRDGVELSADIYLPKVTHLYSAPFENDPNTIEKSETFPTVLIRTPYSNNGDATIQRARALASLGFACVIQDTRGRYDSDGAFYPFMSEAEDGYDTQEWIGQQAWSNGKIGTSGGSYLGMTQWLSAPLGSPYLTCMAPSITCTNLFQDCAYPGGALSLGVMLMWGMGAHGHTNQSLEYQNWTEAFMALPLSQKDELAGRSIDYWKDWIKHDRYDAYWAQINVEGKWNEMKAPALNIGGWYDLWAEQTFTNFNGLRQHGRTDKARQSKLIVGPWTHNLVASSKVGDIDFGPQSMLDLAMEEFRWLSYWLKGEENGVVDEPPVKLFIMGINQWRDENEWPLARTEWQKWHIHSNGSANTLRGDGTLTLSPPTAESNTQSTDHFVYDPRFPVQTKGGNTCCRPQIVPWGPYDQRSVEMRSDVLCYTTPPLDEDLEVTGPIKLILYAATDAQDTDWTAKLVDVSPSGYAKNLCDGILRARYRESMSTPTLLEPNKVYEYTINVGVTGNVFRRGHSMRLEISSSNFPRFNRNLNTGKSYGEEIEMRAAHQTIYHDSMYPSHLILPVIPSGG